MTLVDYHCDACGATHEVFAPSPVPDTTTCPDCGGSARRRYGLGGLLGVRPARRARERLDRERAERATNADAHAQGHVHHHGHHHHDHHDDHQPEATTEEER